ncbi:MAG: DUF58 domain-containing protein [Candidatus Nanohalobium sp.]
MSQLHLDKEDIIEEARRNSFRMEDRIRILILYKKIVTGAGLEFDRLRKYVPGDQAKMIDWNSFARTGNLYTKIFDEDRLLNVLIIQDFSDSMKVGTTDILKHDYASIISTTLAITAQDAGDQVGFVAFSDDIKESDAPSLDEEIPYRIADKTENKEIYSEEADWESLANHVLPNFESETFVFVISDFVGDMEPAEKFLIQAEEKFHGVFTVMVRDPLDSELPEGVGQAYLGSPSSSDNVLVNVDKIREEYNEKAAEQEARIKSRMESLGQDFMLTHTDEEFTKSLAAYLDRRY